MKAFYIPAALLALILACSLWTGRYVREHTDEWITVLENTDQAAMEENWPGAAEFLRKAYSGWDGSQGFLHVVMNHSDLDGAETLFAAAGAMCERQDADDFHQTLAQLIEQMRLLAETQSVSLKNIF